MKLRPKPGDLFIELNNGDGSISYLLPKAKVGDIDRQRMRKLTEAFRILFVEGHDIVGITDVQP